MCARGHGAGVCAGACACVPACARALREAASQCKRKRIEALELVPRHTLKDLD